MSNLQSGILASVPPVARYLTFSLAPAADPRPVLARIARLADGERTVLGCGRALLGALGVEVAGLGEFPARSAAGVVVPSTPAALWCWLRGEDRGELVHRSRALRAALAPHLRLDEVTDAFRHGAGLDLTGYEDGTENPVGDAAITAAEVRGAGMDGASVVAVQRWVHDLDAFAALGEAGQDSAIGRRRIGNQEIDDAPVSAHVKRTAQESFDPEAYVLRRSMPWADAEREGLVFVAFGRDTTAFEALLGRMVGDQDGVADALFGFTRPVTGGYFWCPPAAPGGGVDLTALGV